MLYFSGKIFVKKYFPPAAPISHQERAKSAEYHKKQRCLRKKFFEQFQKILFRYYIFQENFSWKKNFPPAAPISHQERAKSAEYPIKAKMSEKKVLQTIFKKYFLDVIFFRKIFREKIFSPSSPY